MRIFFFVVVTIGLNYCLPKHRLHFSHLSLSQALLAAVEQHFQLHSEIAHFLLPRQLIKSHQIYCKYVAAAFVSCRSRALDSSLYSFFSISRKEID